MVVKHLQTNIRVHLCGDQAGGQFADQLLAIGEGKFPTDDDSISSYLVSALSTSPWTLSQAVEFPTEFLNSFRFAPILTLVHQL